MKNVILSITLIFFAGQGLYAQKINSAPTPKTASAKKIKPRLTLDFISKGGGVDAESFDKIENAFKNHAKKPAYNVKQKGKEGEKTLTSMLTELTKEEQSAFVMELRGLIVKVDHVLVTEFPAPKKLGGTAIEVSKPKVRLAIHFISKGAGIDLKSREKIDEFISKNPKKIQYEIEKWGREGEVSYVFQLKELTSDEQKVFVEEVKKLIVNADMVSVKENEVYVKKGR